MPFNKLELDNVRDHLRGQGECYSLVEQCLDEETYAFLRNRSMIHLMNDRVHVPKVNKREHNSISITKFLTPDVNIPQFIDDICKPLVREYEIKIDFGFMTLKTDDDGEDVRQYCWPQRSTHVNNITKIFTVRDKISLRYFLSIQSKNDVLNLAFIASNKQCEFQKSGYRPYRLLTLAVFITK